MATALTIKKQRVEKGTHEERTTALFNSTDSQGTLTTGVLIADSIHIQPINATDVVYPVVKDVGGYYALNGKLTLARSANTSALEVNVRIVPSK